MTNTDLASMTKPQLAQLADSLRCPDGMRTPFNSAPLPTTKPKLIAMIEGLRARRADSLAIERAVRG